MPRIKKEKPKFIVVPDTNILWFDNKTFPVNPAFNEMCNECGEILEIELVVPSIVYGELFFQQAISANKALDRATQAFTEISDISARLFSHRITKNKIKKCIKTKLDRWVLDNKIRVAQVPINSIIWDALIEKAVWREPPFTYDPKDKVSEKGFRDALILETFIEMSKTEGRDVSIVFLSSDELLRKTAEQALKNDSRCSFFDSIDGFRSYVKLTGEELTKKYINRLLIRATEKFYKKNDETCLYTRNEVFAKLYAKFKEYFDKPQNTELSLSLASPSIKWKIVNQPKILIDNAQFAEIKPEKIYHWSNQLTYSCVYREDNAGSSQMLKCVDDKKLLILRFQVTWHSFVKSDGRFHDVTLDELILKSDSFEPPTDEQIKKFGLTVGGD